MSSALLSHIQYVEIWCCTEAGMPPDALCVARFAPLACSLARNHHSDTTAALGATCRKQASACGAELGVGPASRAVALRRRVAAAWRIRVVHLGACPRRAAQQRRRRRRRRRRCAACCRSCCRAAQLGLCWLREPADQPHVQLQRHADLARCRNQRRSASSLVPRGDAPPHRHLARAPQSGRGA